MPPKKDADAEDGDAGGGGGRLEEELNLIGGKDLVLARMEVDTLQINLKGKIQQNKELNKACDELKEHLETQKADAKDIYYYLHKKLDDNYDVIDSLEKRIIVLQTERERSDEMYEEKIAHMNKEFAKERQNYEAVIKDLRESAHTLKEFKENKHAIEQEMKRVKAELKAEIIGRADDISELERRNIQEKERLKKEMLIKIKETKKNLLSMTEDQLHTTTKRTILENEQMSTELQYQSKETERMLRRFNKMSEENRQLKCDVEILKENEKEYAKKSHFFQKLIKKLHEKLKDQSSAAISTIQKAQPVRPSLDVGRVGNRGHSRARSSESQSRYAEPSKGGKNSSVIRALQEKAGSLEVSLEQVLEELDATRRQLLQAQQQQDSEQTDRNAAVTFLLACLTDIKKGNVLIGDAQSWAGPAVNNSMGDVSETSGPQQGGFHASLVGNASGIDGGGSSLVGTGLGGVPPGHFSLQQREAVLTYLLAQFSDKFRSGGSQGRSTGTFQTQDSTDVATAGSSVSFPPIGRAKFDDENLANEFSRLFATSGAPGSGTDRSVLASAMIHGTSVQSIGVQTDSAAPITILRSVDVGVRPKGLFSGDGAGDDGYGYSIGGGQTEGDFPTNGAESLTSRLLRGAVRDWGKPAPLYTKVGGKKTGSEMFLKRHSGFGGGKF